MILGIGIDMVDIERFKEWHTKSFKELSSMFSADEIAYCLEIPAKSSERFAVRFAAKEAFYKAYCSWQKDSKPLLFTMCKAVSISKTNTYVPYLLVNWQALNVPFEPICHVTLTHTAKMALAQVLLSQV